MTIVLMLDVESRHPAGAGYRRDATAGSIDLEQAMLADIVSTHVERFAVRRPRELRHRAIPFVGQGALLAAGDVHQHQMKAVSFETGAIHRDIGQGAAVR